jgi:hypothetical protein
MPRLSDGSIGLDPVVAASSYMFITIGGRRSPGIIASIDGFDRNTGWDVKEGKGQQGATLTRKSAPPAKGSITFRLGTSQQFTDMYQFVAFLRYAPGKDNKGAFDIYHPFLAINAVNTVVVESITPITHAGRGMYEITISFIEYLPPPPTNITKTPTSSTGNNSKDAPGAQPDPIGDQQQKIIASLLKTAASL